MVFVYFVGRVQIPADHSDHPANAAGLAPRDLGRGQEMVTLGPVNALFGHMKQQLVWRKSPAICRAFHNYSLFTVNCSLIKGSVEARLCGRHARGGRDHRIHVPHY